MVNAFVLRLLLHVWVAKPGRPPNWAPWLMRPGGGLVENLVSLVYICGRVQTLWPPCSTIWEGMASVGHKWRLSYRIFDLNIWGTLSLRRSLTDQVSMMKVDYWALHFAVILSLPISQWAHCWKPGQIKRYEREGLTRSCMWRSASGFIWAIVVPFHDKYFI